MEWLAGTEPDRQRLANRLGYTSWASLAAVLYRLGRGDLVRRSTAGFAKAAAS